MLQKIDQVWIPYWLWEDYKNGMWRKSDNEETQLQQAIDFTGNWQDYGAAMLDVVLAWKNTMFNSLTNPAINKRAFVGHCAVCYRLGIPEYITRMAWKLLTDNQRYEADSIAQQTIDAWKSDYGNILTHGRQDVTIAEYLTKHQRK